MFAVTVTYSIRLGQQAAFMRALEAHVRETVEGEMGLLRAVALGDPSRPGKATLVQVFEAAGDFDAYRASRAARAFDSDVVDIVTNRAIATWAEVIELGR